MSQIETNPLLSAFHEQRDALMRFLLRRVGDVSLAEDLAQETWLRAANSQSTVAINNPRAYLFRIAANLAMDHFRHTGLRIEVAAPDHTKELVSDGTPSPETVALYRSEFARLHTIVEGLSPRCREVFTLARFQGLDNSEIAERLGISKNTVISHIFNALKIIEREMNWEKRNEKKT